MTEHFAGAGRLITGDCVEVMAEMDAESIDAIVTDPPYSLAFMGKAWDKNLNHGPWAEAALRVAKPGAYLLAFGGTRTVHRLTVALEDAGWIIRDLLVWGYASGFPKSKASLKPAWEPIVLARKPGPLAKLRIDECRLPTTQATGFTAPPAGRWPANIVLTDPIFDGTYSRFFIIPKASRKDREPDVPGELEATSEQDGTNVRNARCRKCKRVKFAADATRCHCDSPEWEPSSLRRNTHPTVKPTALMRHLIRLVTPEGGTVLDPFLGSGTTAKAAVLEGIEWVGIEREPEYVRIAEQRLVGLEPEPEQLPLARPQGTRRHAPARRAGITRHRCSA